MVEGLQGYTSPVAEFRVDRDAVHDEATTTGRPFHEVYKVYQETMLTYILEAIASEAPERHAEVEKRIEKLRYREGYTGQRFKTALRSLWSVRIGMEAWWFTPLGFYRGFPEDIPDEDTRREQLAAAAERLCRRCGMPSVFWGMEVEDVEPRPDIEPFAEALSATQELNGRRGFFIRGNPGVGKSLLAALAAKRALRRGFAVVWTNAASYIEATKPKGDRAFADHCYTVDVLVLDDLGQERQTEFALTEWDTLISYRYDNNLPVIASTNFSGEHFAALYGQRVVDRLRDSCSVFDLCGPSYRGRRRP